MRLACLLGLHSLSSTKSREKKRWLRGQARFEAQSRMASRVDSMPNAVAKRFSCHMGLKGAQGRHKGRERQREEEGKCGNVFRRPIALVLPMLVLKGWFPLPLVLAVIVSALGVCVGRLSCPNEGMCLPFSP